MLTQWPQKWTYAINKCLQIWVLVYILPVPLINPPLTRRLYMQDSWIGVIWCDGMKEHHQKYGVVHTYFNLIEGAFIPNQFCSCLFWWWQFIRVWVLFLNEWHLLLQNGDTYNAQTYVTSEAICACFYKSKNKFQIFSGIVLSLINKPISTWRISWFVQVRYFPRKWQQR